MASSTTESKPLQSNVSIAEAFYRVFCALPKKDRLAVVRYILEDELIRQHLHLPEIPNDTTLKAFGETKSGIPVFETIQELREDLLS